LRKRFTLDVPASESSRIHAWFWFGSHQVTRAIFDAAEILGCGFGQLVGTAVSRSEMGEPTRDRKPSVPLLCAVKLARKFYPNQSEPLQENRSRRHRVSATPRPKDDIPR
jgi:hypothetical protein